MEIVKVVKYNGGPDVFAWKFPSEALGTWTQLIVNESQEAILFKEGKVLDVFKSGRYTLDTPNIPILSAFMRIPFGGKSPFAAEVWFVNKVNSLDIKWGTSTPIQLQDPKYGIFISVRSFGQFGIKIEDSKKFLTKLVGTLPILGSEEISRYFRGVYVTKVKDAISSYITKKRISVLEINSYLEEISEHMEKQLEPVLEQYGIRLVNFYVNDINIPEEDSGVKKLKKALSEKARMDVIGYNYQQQRSFDTLEKAAENPGMSANLMGAGMGVGMGMAMGAPIATGFNEASRNLDMSFTQREKKECPNCHAKIDKEEKFCSECGFDTLKVANTSKREPVCINCGAKITATMKFCSECGEKIKTCPNCGAGMRENDKKCSICGFEVDMKCPKCGIYLSAKKLKFCPECGVSLIKKCPACDTTVEGNEKFCHECGKQL